MLISGHVYRNRLGLVRHALETCLTEFKSNRAVMHCMTSSSVTYCNNEVYLAKVTELVNLCAKYGIEYAEDRRLLSPAAVD